MSDPAPPPLIDRGTFAELQANAGADFVVELVDTFAEEAPLLLDGAARAGLGEAFDVEALGPTAVVGKREPVEVWALSALRSG